MLLEELKAVNSTYSCFTHREALRNNRVSSYPFVPNLPISHYRFGSPCR